MKPVQGLVQESYRVTFSTLQVRLGAGFVLKCVDLESVPLVVFKSWRLISVTTFRPFISYFCVCET